MNSQKESTTPLFSITWGKDDRVKDRKHTERGHGSAMVMNVDLEASRIGKNKKKNNPQIRHNK